MKTKRIAGVLLFMVWMLLILQGTTLAEADDRGFVGTINGKDSIRMRLGVTGNELSGFYFYDTVRTMISVRGTLDKDKNVTLKEFDSKGNWVATFRGKWTNKGMEGTWVSQDGTKKYPFSLSFTTTATVSAGRYLFTAGATEGVFIYDGRLKLQKQIPTTSRIVQIRKDTNYLYILEETNRLTIYEIKNPKQPVLITEYTGLVAQLPFTDFFVENNRLVLFNPRMGLVFLDIKERKKPLPIGTYAIDGRTPEFAYANNKGYFYDEVRFYAVDFTDLSKPRIFYDVEHHHLEEAVGNAAGSGEYTLRARILVNGPRVYIFSVGLTTYDFSRNDVRVTRSEVNPYLNHVAMFGKYLYVTTTYSSLCIYELVNFDTAKLVAEYDADFLGDDDLQGLLIQDNKYLYIAGGRRGIVLKNVEDPKRVLSWTCSEKEGAFVDKLYTYKDKLILQSNTGWFDVIDPATYKVTKDFSSSLHLWNYRYCGDAMMSTQLDGNRLYVPGLLGFVQIYNLDRMEQEAREEAPFDIERMVVHGSRIYFLSSMVQTTQELESLLDIYTITPGKLESIGTFQLTNFMSSADQADFREGKITYQVLNLFFKDHLAYVEYGISERSAAGQWEPARATMVILDLTDPKRPLRVSEQEPILGLVGFVQPDYALSRYGRMIDFRNPKAPTRVQTLPDLAATGEITTIYDLEMIGSLGYLACGSKGMQIYDFSDPLHPTWVQSIKIDGFVGDIAILGKKAFVAAGYNGYLAYDITDPKQPQLIHNSVHSNLMQVIGY